MDVDGHACHRDINRLLVVSRHRAIEVNTDKRKGAPDSDGLLVTLYSEYRGVECFAVGYLCVKIDRHPLT